MPWNSSERNIGRRPSLSALSTGGYGLAQRPDPNDPVDNLRRGFTPAGDPRQPANVAQLRMDAEHTSQAEAARDAAYGQQRRNEGRIDTVGTQSINGLNRAAQASSPWTLFLQAMKNQGVNHVTTSAAARSNQGGSDEMGFYENQSPAMTGLVSAAVAPPDAFGMGNYNRKQDQARRRIF